MNLFLQIRRLIFVFSFAAATVQAADELRLATFDIDVTPPVGALVAYDPVKRVDKLGLLARGVVLLGAGDPIVLCALDWVGIANGWHEKAA